MDSMFGENGQSTAYDSTEGQEEKQHMGKSCELDTKHLLQQCAYYWSLTGVGARGINHTPGLNLHLIYAGTSICDL